MQEWREKSAAQIGRAIGQGDLDPVALTQSYLEAIAAHPHGAEIYARLTPERALAEAQAARKRAQAGLRLSPLDGVPVSWKDLFDTGATATEAGSALLKGRVPSRDAEVLANATALGLVCLGKTHMSELAFSGLGLNPITATPPCVNDAEAVPGGSSSGAAASVAFGLAAAAVGSDTGGSVRIPAAWNDLVGLKTTSARLSVEGTVPLCPRFDTVGPLTQSVEDAGLMLALLAGEKAPDLGGADLKDMRFATLETVALDDIRPEPLAAYERALQRLRDAGAEVVPLDLPELTEAMGLSGVLYTSEAYATWREVIEANPKAMFAEILERFRGGAGHSATDYLAAWAQLERARAVFARASAGFDAVLCPTAPILPPNKARLLNDHAYYLAENLLALRNTRIGNLMGACALTLPTGVPSCGLQILCPPFAEARLLRIGAAAERVLGDEG